MKRIISFTIMCSIKLFARLFYRFEVNWLNCDPNWKNVRLIIFLNHTSLYEPLFIGITPISFIWELSAKLVAPGADKTLNRPLVGKFWRFMGPGMIAISRKRDHTWQEFMRSISDDSIITIAPEGRMKRAHGKDLQGLPMSVKGGVADILYELKEGNMLIAYSGGLHHVQFPGQTFPRLFKTLKMNIEFFEIKKYKERFERKGLSASGLKKAIINDLQECLESKCP